ncbi:S24/S26 family peptidase [Paenibacillus pini]|uniref:Signal peptidase I n=1 Tax=Paenibacillus pini JCM 16418 TaxID=1236976 RepID=W7YHZ7_9BACL|nr:hypothetical protein [Paenibacillus pini]GAF08067.1 hypothetical protein JCM16418_2105 [Paenibacillus pini JCM 16418]
MHDQAAAVSGWISRRGSIELPSYGTSMFPLIVEGDISEFMPVDSHNIRVGQVYLFVSNEGLLVGHRLLHVIQEEHENQYIFKGDTNIFPDTAVSLDQILGEWTSVQRKQRRRPRDHWQLRLLSWLALHIHEWPKLMRWYISVKKL